MSLVPSGSPRLDMRSLYTFIHLSSCFPFLHISPGSHASVLRDNLFPGILFTCPKYLNRFSSVTSDVFFPTSIVALMVSFRAFAHFYLLADLIKKK